MKGIVKRSLHWIMLLLATDAVFIFAAWVIRRDALKYMSLFIFLFTAAVLLCGILTQYRMAKKDREVFDRFLKQPCEETKNALLGRYGGSDTVEALYEQLCEQSELINEKTVELSSWREYTEEWVHEAKTPLSLASLVLNNRKDEMSPYVYRRMSHVQHRLNEDVERILFWARLNTDHSDMKFTRFCAEECINQVLEDYRLLIEEKNISLSCDTKPLTVVSDKRTVSFMLSQLISNAVKYADETDAKICVRAYAQADKVHIGIYNNGSGVPAEDAPFIFDKGFTGGSPDRQAATGMGLYLVRKYADMLCAQVRTDDAVPFERGFGIELIFTL